MKCNRKFKKVGVAAALLLLTGIAARAEAATEPLWTTAAPVTFASGLQSASQNDAGEDISCSSAGNCTAVGRFKNATGGYVPFTLTSTSGTWAQAVPVVFASGVHHATFNDSLTNVSCSSAGNCTAVGRFKNAAGGVETFAVSSTNGTWAQAVPVVFAAGVQNTSHGDILRDVSCASAGNCTAVGEFKNAAGDAEAFTVSSTGGTWAQAMRVVFGSGLQNANPNDSLVSVSCASAGNCTAGGYFQNSNSPSGQEAFSVTSTNGAWAQAVPVVFGAGVQSQSKDGNLRNISCMSAGNCTAVGHFENTAGYTEAFVTNMINGTWTLALPVVFGTGVQASAPDATTDSVSCVSIGNCSVIGGFANLAGDYEVFVASSSYAPPAEISTTVAATTTTTTAKNTTTSKSGSLPSTGSKSNSGFEIALALLFAGFGILAIRRREFQ
jgi:LPXTG-motif cell wall-anchored protein